MRRLTGLAVLAAVLAATPGCRPRDKIRLQSTEEKLNLKSAVHMADPGDAPQLISGFHEIEQNSWRWTAGRFAVILRPPARAKQAVLRVQLSVPDAVLRETGSVTLAAAIDGATIGSQTWNRAGEYTFEAQVPAAALTSEAVTVDFSLDRFLPAGKVETRELGLIVSSVEIS